LDRTVEILRKHGLIGTAP
jgi:hypothetical protein